VTNIIECTEGHYEVRRTSYGEAYVRCPEYVVVECDCGERTPLSTSETVCSCGADHAALIREVLASQKAPHPWIWSTTSGVRSRTSTWFRRKPTGWS
jgi:hypothetical protein